jgi:hypothetical protein
MCRTKLYEDNLTYRTKREEDWECRNKPLEDGGVCRSELWDEDWVFKTKLSEDGVQYQTL